MRLILSIILWSTLHIPSIWSQSNDISWRRYAIEDGLSHRNVFGVQQDSLGLLWIATINGLNKFDGEQFTSFSTQSAVAQIPHDYISDLTVSENGYAYLAHPNFLTRILLDSMKTETFITNSASQANGQERLLKQLIHWKDRLYCLTQLKSSGQSIIQRSDLSQTVLELHDFVPLEGTFTDRAMSIINETLYFAGQEHQIWSSNGIDSAFGRIELPVEIPANSWVTAISEADSSRILFLTQYGDLWYFYPGEKRFTPHPLHGKLDARQMYQYLYADELGNCWIAGRDVLFYYNAQTNRLFNLNQRIQSQVKHTLSYRDIFRDATGVYWISSNYGLIKARVSNDLFTTYLNDGNELCNDGICSMRGIAEDNKGNIYFTYYNSIHQLNPLTGRIKPLFAQNSYFDYPFGITFHEGALYTGNGKRINLQTLKIDTLLRHPSQDKGYPMTDPEGNLWIGYENRLYQQDSTGAMNSINLNWPGLDTTDLDISYLHYGDTSGMLWIGTNAQGIIAMDPKEGITQQWRSQKEDGILSHDRILAIYESSDQTLWIATANGLNRHHLPSGKHQVYLEEDGLPNAFINGLLSEGDSSLWISTDFGLSRFDIQKEQFTNFFVEDGLSANEFNRISFYRAQDGRMYFGGMNGINAFYPRAFTRPRQTWKRPNILLTEFSRYDGQEDSLYVQQFGLHQDRTIILHPQDRFFTFHFALADYRTANDHIFSYRLEGYETNWTRPSAINFIRYNNLPSGKYTLHVRAESNAGRYKADPIQVSIQVLPPFYLKPLFIGSMAGLFFLIWYGIYRLKLYNSTQLRKRLEKEVLSRTHELEREKKKSEDLLLNILPAQTADELKKFGRAKARRHETVTVFFSDFKDFSRLSGQLEPEALVQLIDETFRAFDEIMELYGLEKIKTIGDAYMCVGGLGDDPKSEAINVVKAALEIQAYLAAIEKEREEKGAPHLEARIGIHTGPVVSGVVGIHKFAYDIYGDTVNVAARMEEHGAVGKINISATTHELVCEYFSYTYRGPIDAKGVEGIGMYLVEGVKE